MSTTSLPTQPSPPDFASTPAAPAGIGGVEVIALPVLPGEDGPLVGPGADGLDADLLGALEVSGATGKAGEITTVPVVATTGNPDLRLVLLVGVGAGTTDDVRRAGAALSRATRDRSSVASTLHLVGEADGILRAFVVGMTLGSFVFDLRSQGPRHLPVGQVVLALTEDREAELAAALGVAWASWHARLLATVPSNIKNPGWMADQAVRVAEGGDLEVTVLDETELAKQGFGGILGVGQASATPPRLVQLTYTPARKERVEGHVVLVGKGITFDSGGLSIKPGESMSTMKRDMTGAGVVLATMAALRDLGCRVKVTGLLCLAENVISGEAMRPGDVITHYGGRTSEVTNTDAEGRLVLGDGLAYAVDRLKPTALVDIATLTGGIKVALGQRVGGLFASDDALAGSLLEAGDASGEPLWPMPLSDLYEEKIGSSKVADADNAPGGPPAITAALFLQHFTGGLPWAHLDIASVGDAVEDAYEWTAGPTGYGARVLLHWLESEDPLAGVR